MEYVYVTYVKGVLFFDNLNELVGDKKFEKSLKYYFEENKFRNAIPSNLISAFEKMVKTANEENCDLFVITGDLFENTTGPAKKEIKTWLNQKEDEGYVLTAQALAALFYLNE